MIDIHTKIDKAVREYFLKQLSEQEQKELVSCRERIVTHCIRNGNGNSARKPVDRIANLISKIAFCAVSIDGNTLEVFKGVKENFDPETDEFLTKEDCEFIF